MAKSTAAHAHEHRIHELPRLPYEEAALEPVISRRTLSLHHGKHHRAYVDKLNELIDGTDLAGMTLEDVIRMTGGDGRRADVFNNAAQTWNHTFYWHSMRPKGGGTPPDALLAAIEREFGDFDTFKKTLHQTAVEEFGSGWAWVVIDDGKIAVRPTTDADTPIAHSQTPLIGLDVWEHAYYLDYQNRRPDYVAAWIDKLADWEAAAQRFEAARGRGEI